MWAVLGIAPTTDSIEIRRAYARRMKESDVGDDAEAFAELRAARADALAWAETVTLDDDEDALAQAEEETEPAVLGFGTPVLADAHPVQDSLSVAAASAGEAGVDATPPIAGAATGRGDGISLDTGQWLVPELDVAPQADFVTPSDHATDDDYHALAALLFPENGGEPAPLDDSDMERVEHHLRRVLDDPRMQELGYYGDVERWLSEVMAGAIPRSDPLLARIADHFGWMAKADEVGETPAVAHVTARLGALSFAEAVQAPGHRYRRAWRELTTPADGDSRRGWVRRKRVLELLSTVRRHHPQLEHAFDWYRVGLWERADGAGHGVSNGLPAFIFIALLVVGLNMVNAIFIGDKGRTPPAVRPPITAFPTTDWVSPELETPDRDIEVAIDRVSNGLADGGNLAERNPDLHGALKRIWIDDEAAGVTRNGFERHVREHLGDRYPRIVGHASHADLVDNAQSRLAIAHVLRNAPADCANYFQGKAMTIPADVDRRRRTVFYRILMDTRGKPDPVNADTMFQIDNSILEKAAKRAGLSVDDLVVALNNRGGAKAICDARIALAELAVELPAKQGMQILPHL